MKDASRILLRCMAAVLVILTGGCSAGAHSTASRVANSPQPPATSEPVYLAQSSCWDTESCCILRDPLTAAQRCMVRAERIAEVVRGVKTVYGVLQSEASKPKDEAQAREDADFAEAAEATGEAAPEPPDCQGQDHHVISRPIARKLDAHETLSGLYEPRDKRFVAKAKDKDSHCGYQKWHRDVDLEVIEWLRRYGKATREEFEAFLRGIYNRKDMLERFPNGFGPQS